MLGNISILICSFILMGILSFYLFKKWPDLDVLDLYIIFILFHFGVYPFVRGLSFEKGHIFDFRDSDPLVIVLVFVQVLLILAILKIMYRYLPDNIVEVLKIRNLIQQWSLINKFTLFSVYGGLIVFQIISYYAYGIKTYIHPTDFARIGHDLPYWFTSVRTIYPLLTFLVCLGLVSLWLKSSGPAKYGWLVLIAGFLPVATLYGRRFLLAFLIIMTILWFIEKKKNIFSFQYLVSGSLIVLVFFLFSNIYEAYRYNLQAIGPLSARFGRNTIKQINPYRELINFEATLKNFRERPGTWEFNYLVFNHQFNTADMTTNGQVIWEGFKGAIPRMFWPHKQFLWTDEILAGLYQVNIKQIDIGKNIFGIGQVDFGYFSLIIVPLIILIIITLMGISIKITMNYPTWLWLLSGNILFYLVNIEENGNEIFFMIRNTLLILMMFYCYRAVNKVVIKLHNFAVGESG